jgi:hypothetical protein
MNIFAIDSCPVVAAQSLCDKHIVKMVLETGQILSTVQSLLGITDDRLYKPTHKNHPCTIWVRESIDNYEWTYLHFVALAEEYQHRYNKIHKSFQRLEEVLSTTPSGITLKSLTPFALAMPDEFKRSDAIDSYRLYYRFKRDTIPFRYTKRETPEWLNS